MNKSYMFSHIPVVRVPASTAYEDVPDWMSATYVELGRQPIDFQVHIVEIDHLGYLDLLAYDYYGDVDWWWLIATFNGIVDQQRDMYIGQRLLIPDLRQAQAYMDAVERQRAAYVTPVLTI